MEGARALRNRNMSTMDSESDDDRPRSPVDGSKQSKEPKINQQRRKSNNIFSTLQNNVTENELSGRNDVHTTSNRNIKKIPPIIVEGLKISDVQGILSKITYLSTMPNIKNTINGHHSIYAKTLSNHNKIERFLRDNKISGYTHEIEQRVKFVIYGLHTVDTNDLREELTKNLNTSPIHVYSIPIREKKYSDQNVYVVHFMKSSGVSLNKLRLTKALFNVIVQWDMYQPNKGGNSSDIKPPTQCSNCQSFNHGSRNCFKPPKCIRCGESHKSAQCVHLFDKNELGEVIIKNKIADNLIKCANCGERHTANFRGCSVRQQIINNRIKLRQNQPTKHQMSPPLMNDKNFPPPPPPGHPNGNNTWRNTGTTHPSNNVSNNLNSQSNNVLFSYETCNTILNEFITRLSACKTKIDQLQIIGDIAFKYLYD